MKYDIKITGFPEFTRQFDNLLSAENEVKMLARKIPLQKENIYIDEYQNDGEIFRPTGVWFRLDKNTGEFVGNV